MKQLQPESYVALMAFAPHNHTMAPISSNNPHEMGTQYFVGSHAEIGAEDSLYFVSNGRSDFYFADNTASSSLTSPAPWSSGQQLLEPQYPFESNTHHGTLQGDFPAYGVSPSFSPLPTTNFPGQADYSFATSFNSTSTSTETFSSPSPSLSSTLSVDLDTIGEEFEPCTMPDPIKNVIGSQKIAAAAYKRRSRTAKFICPYYKNGCGAEFTARHNLEYHINSHTGRKPYKCNKGCSYAAPSPATVRRHERACQG